MKKGYFYFWFIFFWMLLDQATKFAIVRFVPLLTSVKIIPGFLNITHIHNRGAIFGFFSKAESRVVYLLLTLASLAALGLVIYYFFKTPREEKLTKISLALIMAGALGNLIDRISKGYVVDFLDFYIQRWHWPFFNIADSCITVGAFLLLFSFLRRRPQCSPSSSS